MNSVNEQSNRNSKKTIVVLAVFAAFVGLGLLSIAEIPLFWTSGMATKNENSVVQTIDKIRTLQIQHASKNLGRFAANFDELNKNDALGGKFAGTNCVVYNYVFTMKVELPSSGKPAFYSINADPQGSDANDNRHYYTDSTLKTIRQTEENRPAKADDSPL